MSEQTAVITITEQVRQLVVEVALAKGLTEIADDESLLKNGALDSLSMYRLIELVESAFPVKIADDEMVPDNFESINRLGHFVSTKLEKSPVTNLR